MRKRLWVWITVIVIGTGLLGTLAGFWIYNLVRTSDLAKTISRLPIKQVNVQEPWLGITLGSLGFIMLVALGFSTLLDSLQDYLTQRYSDTIIYVLYAVNIFVTVLITSLLFAAIFVILPDAKIKWRQVRLASITTTLLFLIGKFGISFYITSSNINTIYGAAGSIVILMLWVYYSSVILYLGATFAKFYAIEFSTAIKPSEFAEIVQKVEITSYSKSLQEEEKKKPLE